MITLKEYLERLNKLVEEHPEYLDLPLIYSVDDEGNRYEYVIAGAEMLYWYKEYDDIRDSLNGFTEESKQDYKQVICIN